MSETVAAEAASGAGALLRRAREEAGLHVAALAGALKVPQRQIEALEQDRIDQLPDVVYARALAASVCRNLRIDPQPVLARLPKAGDSRLGRDEPINVPFRPAGEPARGTWRDLLGRPPVLAALALLIGAVVLLLLPLIPNRPAEPVTSGTPAPAVPDAAPASAPAGASPGMVTESVAAPGTGAPAPAGVPAVVPLTPAPPAAAVNAPSTAVAGAEPVIAFTAARPAWVQVTDGRGTVHLRRNLAAGESASVTGPAPLSVVVGSANTTQVQVRGQPFQLAPHARDNVARFEVR